METTTFTTMKFALVAAPLLTVVYGGVRLLDGLDGTRGPGLAWTTGHLAFLAALVLFVPVLAGMRREAGRGALATVTTVAGLVGIGCAIAQIVIDIVVGLMATDHADMQRSSGEVQDVPGVEIAVYAVGPAVFYIAITMLAVHLAAVRVVPAWAPVAVFLGAITPPVSLDLLPLGGLLMLAGFVPLLRSAQLPAPVAA